MRTNRPNPNRDPNRSFEVNTIRPFDSAPRSIITPTVRVRAQARKDQIMAMRPDAQPAVRVPGSLRYKRAWLIGAAALPAAAAVILGVPAVLSSGAGDAEQVAGQFTGTSTMPEMAEPILEAGASAGAESLPGEFPATDTSEAASPAPFDLHAQAPLLGNFASWTASPVSLDEAHQQAIRNTCWSDITASQSEAMALGSGAPPNPNQWTQQQQPAPPPWWGVPPNLLSSFEFLGAEARGDWGAAFWRNPAGNVAYCLTYTDPASGEMQTFTWNLTFGSFSWFGAIGDNQAGRSRDIQRDWIAAPTIVGRDEVVLAVEHGTEPFRGEPFNIAIGRVGADVTGVQLATVDGQTVSATVADDTFFAWWPGEIMPDQHWLLQQAGIISGGSSTIMGFEGFGDLRCDWPRSGVLSEPIADLLAADPDWHLRADGSWVCTFETLPDFARRDSAITKMTGYLHDGTAREWGIAAAWRPWALPYEVASRPVQMQHIIWLDGVGGGTMDIRPIMVP